jgi:hypothetical protein
MFNDAKRPQAGRLVVHNPFAGLRLPQGRGRKDTQPPAQEQLALMVRLADDLTPPSFAAYQQPLPGEEPEEPEIRFGWSGLGKPTQPPGQMRVS